MNDAVQRLMQTSLGNTLSAAEASELAQSATVRSIARGNYLFRAGESSDAFFVILQGAFDVVLGQAATGEAVVATLGAGQLAGELEAMTRSLRVASLVATEEATVLDIPLGQMQTMLADNRAAANKLVQHIAKTLARRLAAVNQMILARAPKPEPAIDEPVEQVSEADVMPIDDEDLGVLDKLWG